VAPVSETRTTTGYVGPVAAVPCDAPVPLEVAVEVAVGSRLMEVTVPAAEAAAPCGVTFATCPT
jgi:hypothetical protein